MAQLRANGGDGGLAVGVTGGDSLSVPGGGGSGGRIILDAMSVYEGPLSSTTAIGGRGNKGKPYDNQNTMYKDAIKKQNHDGADGSIYTTTKLKLSYYIDVTGGALGTDRSLILRGKHSSLNVAGYEKDQPMPLSGVKYSLNYDHPNGTQPMRVSYFMKFGKYGSGSDVNNVGSYFALHPQENQVEAVFPPGPMEDVSAPSSVAKSGGEVLIGLAIVNGHLHHAANYDTLPGVAMGSKDSLAMEFMEHDRWYKIDIIISWFNQTYMIRVDDNIRVIDATFRGSRVGKLASTIIIK